MEPLVASELPKYAESKLKFVYRSGQNVPPLASDSESTPRSEASERPRKGRQAASLPFILVDGLNGPRVVPRASGNRVQLDNPFEVITITFLTVQFKLTRASIFFIGPCAQRAHPKGCRYPLRQFRRA